MPSLMDAVIEGNGLILKEPFINEVKNVNGGIRMNNIRNKKM